MLFCQTYGNVLARKPDHYATSLLKLLLCLFGHLAFDMKATLFLPNVMLLLWGNYFGCFFLLSKGLSWLCVFCFGYTRIADNFCVVLFFYNSHKVVLASLDVPPNQFGWTIYKTSLDFPNPSSHSAMDLLHFLLIYGKPHMHLNRMI